MDTRITYGLVAGALAIGGAVLFLYRDLNTIDAWYLLLLLLGTLGISFAVGWVLGYLTDNDPTPGPGRRE